MSLCAIPLLYMFKEDFVLKSKQFNTLGITQHFWDNSTPPGYN